MNTSVSLIDGKVLVVGKPCDADLEVDCDMITECVQYDVMSQGGKLAQKYADADVSPPMHIFKRRNTGGAQWRPLISGVGLVLTWLSAEEALRHTRLVIRIRAQILLHRDLRVDDNPRIGWQNTLAVVGLFSSLGIGELTLSKTPCRANGRLSAMHADKRGTRTLTIPRAVLFSLLMLSSG